MKKEIKHYNIDNLVSQNADINILFGERSNGKSWQLKHKRAIINYLQTGKRFILIALIFLFLIMITELHIEIQKMGCILPK